MNSFGRRYRVTIFGESHGGAVGVVIDGCPAGMELAEADLRPDLERRRSGAKGTTPRREADMPRIVSGVFDGHTTGAPLTILFENTDTRSGDYSDLLAHPRPGHADMVAAQKYGGYADYRGGGHFSGRITLGLVAAGAVAKKILGGVEFSSEIIEIGGRTTQFDKVIESAIESGDSVGGVVECRVEGLEAGLGEPFFDSAESVISHLLFSIPAVKGVEFGAGFAAARMRGSENNDPITERDGRTSTNNAGGINGGITNGNPLVFRIAVKPTPSIGRPQRSLNVKTGEVEEFSIKGRHDACIALRVPVIAEAAAAVALADLKRLF